MNDFERMLLSLSYFTNPKKVEEDVREFLDSFEKVSHLLEDEKSLKKINPMDIVSILCDLKEFSNCLKNFVIKYGIVMNLGNMEDKED